MRRLLMVMGAAVLLAGCSSAVKLDDVPVEDKSGTTVSQGGANDAGLGVGAGAGIGKAGVASVDLNKSTEQAVNLAGPRIVYFDYDSFVIKPEFQSVIELHSLFLKTNQTRKIAIEGHTDDSGGREYNLSLGQKRAEAVRSALGLLGVPDGQSEAVSFGKEKPMVLGMDESARAKNRRVEINYR